MARVHVGASGLQDTSYFGTLAFRYSFEPTRTSLHYPALKDFVISGNLTNITLDSSPTPSNGKIVCNVSCEVPAPRK
jgi:hypothetical protein